VAAARPADYAQRLPGPHESPAYNQIVNFRSYPEPGSKVTYPAARATGETDITIRAPTMRSSADRGGTSWARRETLAHVVSRQQ
jgi:hypothetical protein